MSRPTSPISRTRRDGTEEGLSLTQRDVDFIKFTARWWCTSIDHYIRKTEPRDKWYPLFSNSEEDAWLNNKRFALRRRFNKFSDLDHSSFLTTGVLDNKKTAYWCTTSGGELVGAPWDRYPSGNVTRAIHAWAACDIGTFIESAGGTVYSEREFATGETVNHEPVEGGRFQNAIDNTQESQVENTVRPDLAIPGDDGKFIYIEVERKVRRGIKDYKRKLESYFANDRVSTVWYLVEDHITAKSLIQLTKDLSALNRDMPVRIVRLNINNALYTEADDGLLSDACSNDLQSIGKQPLSLGGQN